MPSAAGRTKATSSPRVLEEEEEVEDDDGRRKYSGEGAAGPSCKKWAPNFTSVEDAVISGLSKSTRERLLWSTLTRKEQVNNQPQRTNEQKRITSC